MDDPGVIIVHAVGVGSRNRPAYRVDRPEGTGAWQFNLFHHPMTMRVAGVEQHIDAPAAVCFAPGQPQWYRGAAGGFTDDWLSCGGPLRTLIARHGLPTGQPFRLGNAEAVQGCLRDLAAEFEGRLAFADEAIADLVRSLVRHLARGRLGADGPDPRRQAVERVRSALRLRCGEAWTVARMAAEAGLGQHRFAVLYRRWAGCSPLHELTWFRMRQAQRQLEGGATVKATARACGYADQLYFSRVFSRWSGRPPSAWPRRERR